ncbi:MAG TPA: hypothetical protein VMD91_02120 [Candidatus Sulfotelmatobacter sp.]|nr:hypothetical protein [Candidatus Sulfotelmatobacter sp.]
MPRFCDIVMKGGITSGIIYPAAVVEIAKTFVFKNVGGTSAGAIAAALTAAAERCRAAGGSTAGFERIGAIPGWLMQDNRLFRLFVPSTSTASLFKILTALAGRPRFQPAVVAKWLGLLWAYPLASLLGAVPGVVLLAVVLRTQNALATWAWVIGLIVATLAVVAGITIAVAVALVRDVLRKLQANGFGIVTGVDEANRANPIALSTWLANELDRTAGIADPTIPLTFGMLWDAKRDVVADGLTQLPDDPDVNLEMITTNLTWGRPYNFPVTTRVFFFDPAELKPYFPDYVVDWMVKRSRPPATPQEAANFAHYAPKLALPLMGDLPVVFATRMSLAFPVLLSAVPLWAADFSQAQPGVTRDLERVWFSDGGISSNFPITLFDSPLPRWPTFGISLAAFPPNHPQRPNEAENVYMIARNSAGRLPVFNRFATVPQFLGAVFGAAQNWGDNTQSVLPGFRDRIATVFLAADEGGLNLDMPPAILERLEKRGSAAGALMVQHFENPSVLSPQRPPLPPGIDWENQRWLRFRSTMGALKNYLAHYALGLRTPQAPDVPYDDLIRATEGRPTWSYPIAPGAGAAVAGLAQQAAVLADGLHTQPTLDDELPHPSPVLVLRPDLRS